MFSSLVRENYTCSYPAIGKRKEKEEKKREDRKCIVHIFICLYRRGKIQPVSRKRVVHLILHLSSYDKHIDFVN
jgi:hypothetical protein